MGLELTLPGVDGQGVVLLWVLWLAHLGEGHPSTIITPQMMMGGPLIPLSQTSPFAGGVEVEEVKITGVVVTPMIPAPPEGGEKKGWIF